MDSSNLITNYLNKMTKIQNTLLGIINKEKGIEMDFQELILFLNELKICKNRNEFKSLLHLLSTLYENHHQKPENMVFIEKIIIHYKDYILKNFQNCDIFSIFKNDNKLLLYLIQSQILKIDENIKRNLKNKDPIYFYHEVKDLLQSNIKKEISKEIPDDFILKREKGENDSYLCEIIRKDSIDEFITYVAKTNISLNHEIKQSIFETNTFLINNSVTLIEYAAFFGSIQIFKYLQLNNVDLTDSLWIYAIHSQNTEIISILEDKNIKSYNFKKCYKEAIKCHFNDMANYIQENYLQENNEDNNNSISPIIYFKHYNFEFIKPEHINQSIFIKLCKYDYLLFVDTLMKTEDIDINALTSINKSAYYEEDLYRIDSSALYKAIESNNSEIANLLLENDNIDVNHKYGKSLVISLESIRLELLIALIISIVPLFLIIFFKKKTITNILLIDIRWLNLVWVSGIIYFIHLLVDIIYESLQVPISIRLLLYIKHISLNSLEFQIETITALHLACINNNAEIVKALLKKKNIDVNAIYCFVQDEIEESNALNLAINNEEIVKSLLLNPNIDINIKYKLFATKRLNRIFFIIMDIILLSEMIYYIYFWFLLYAIFIFCLIYLIWRILRSGKKYLLFILVCAVIIYCILHKNTIIGNNNVINGNNTVIDENNNVTIEKNSNNYEEIWRNINYYLLKADLFSLYIVKFILWYMFPMIYFTIIPTSILSLFYCKYIEKTPLLSAIENGQTETAKLLLSCKNINVSSTYKYRYYEEDDDEKKNKMGIFKYTKEHKLYYKDIYITKTALNIAVEKNNSEIVKFLLLNPNTNVEDSYKYSSWTRFSELSKIWYIYAMESLINYFRPISKKTSLHIAVENTNIDVVKQLLEKSNNKSVENDFLKMQQENAKEVPPLKEKENDSNKSSESKDEILQLIQNFINENYASLIKFSLI